TSPTWAATPPITSAWRPGCWCRPSWPTASGTSNAPPGTTRCTCTGSTTAAWCCSHEPGDAEALPAQRTARRHRHPVLLAAAVLPAALRHRAEDQLRRGRGRHSAVHGNLRVGGEPAADPAQPGQLRVPQRGRAVPAGLPEFAEDRPGQHPAVPADRLPDG